MYATYILSGRSLELQYAQDLGELMTHTTKCILPESLALRLLDGLSLSYTIAVWTELEFSCLPSCYWSTQFSSADGIHHLFRPAPAKPLALESTREFKEGGSLSNSTSLQGIAAQTPAIQKEKLGGKAESSSMR